MKYLASLFFLLLSVASLSAQTSPAGVWNTGSDNTKVEITEVDGSYVAQLISSDNADAKIGKQLMKGIKLDGKEWKGQIYAPKKGEWMDATLTPKGDLLEIKVGSGFMSKTLKWKKG